LKDDAQMIFRQRYFIGKQVCQSQHIHKMQAFINARLIPQKFLFQPRLFSLMESFTFGQQNNSTALTDQEFTHFASGDEAALHQFFKAHYGYITGWLIYREKCPSSRAGEFHCDAVLRVRDKAMRGEVEAGNLRAYLLRTAINLWKMEQRRETSLLKRHEQYLEQLPGNMDELEFDALVRSEEETGLERLQQRSLLAIQGALKLLSDACRQLLTDTIINGIKVGGLAEKYGLKDARGVTAKKQDCKTQLLRHVQQIMQQNGWGNKPAQDLG